MKPVQDLNIEASKRLVTPAQLKAALPISDDLTEQVHATRVAIRQILRMQDPRMLVVVGPCSIHDPEAAVEYAHRLKALADEVSDTMLVLMRVYFEKPRTTIGWKGLISDPHLDGSSDIGAGLHIARKLLIDVNSIGLPAATEMLDPIVPQYIADLISWAAIGARTTESQTHREMASGLSMPVGFKNATNGDVQIAIDAMESARHSHSFIGIDGDGVTSVFKTRGNPDSHVVLRGGSDGPNFSMERIADASGQLHIRLAKEAIEPVLMVDCSHANSSKNHENQFGVLRSVVEQRAAGNKELIGMMIESNLLAGNQKLVGDRKLLRYGMSITDACVDWATTEQMLRHAHEKMKPVVHG